MTQTLPLLVACEFSGRVREAFRGQGVDAYSCDLLPSEQPSPFHVQGDVFDVLASRQWGGLIAYPSCRYLAVSGARWFANRRREQEEALEFVWRLMQWPVEYFALENPISVISSRIRKPDQIIQPWQFGHGETKATCLWLRKFPKLMPTDIVSGRWGRVHAEPPGPERWKNRSRTYQGVADAKAHQWAPYLTRSRLFV